MLELGPDVASLLSSARSLPEAQLRDAASAAVAAVADGSPAEASLGAGAAEQQPLRDGFAGLALLMAECARLHLSPAELKASLCAEHGFSDPRAQLVSSAFEAGRERLRARLLRTAGAPAVGRLTGVRWRCDVPVASSAALAGGQPSAPVFHLQLLGEAGAAQRAGAAQLAGSAAEPLLSCTLSVEQLTQLSFTLKEALGASAV